MAGAVHRQQLPLDCPPPPPAGLGGTSGGPLHLRGGRPLWEWHTPSVCHGPRGQLFGPHHGHKHDLGPSTSLISDPHRAGVLLQPIAQSRRGKLVPVGHRGVGVEGEKGWRRSPVGSTSGGSCIAASTRTLGSVIQCDSGSGLPLDWFDSDQQRHISAHRMDNTPTMTVLAHRSSHRDTVLDTTCLHKK